MPTEVKSNVPKAELVEKYLLGKLEGDHEENFEELMFSNDSVFEQVQVMQDELLDRYLTGTLSEHDKSMVEKRILSHPENLQKLKTVALLIKYALESFDSKAQLHITAAA